MSKPKVIAVCGATACGKSALALELAKQLNGEIVCMDSMQIYRRMDIGTAKPTPQERAVVPHHMLDILEPTQPYAVADYAARAEGVLSEIAARGKTPLLVGGTGLYLKALMHGMHLGGAKGNEQVRARLNAIAQQPDGKTKLHAMLQTVDAASAVKLHPNDVRRVVRALEVYELTGTPMSEQKPEEPERPFEILPLALDRPRDELYKRIEARVHQMMARGLLDEVEALLSSGVPADAQAMQGIGYKELIPVVQGKDRLEWAVQQIILNTRHYAKRQGTWLRTEPKTVWLSAEKGLPLQETLKRAKAFLCDEKGTENE